MYVSVKIEHFSSTAINTLETTPDHINGQLLACVGDRISLTCSRSTDLASGVTRWTVSSPTIPCDSIIDHLAPGSIEHCGPFVFQNVTEITGSQIPTVLSSTAVATANASMSGAIVQCSTYRHPQLSQQIGPNITLCIPGKRYYAYTVAIHVQLLLAHV